MLSTTYKYKIHKDLLLLIPKDTCPSVVILKFAIV